MKMKGFKVFNPDWTCMGFQFEVGKIYEEDVRPTVYSRGFHFCEKASDCFIFYDFDSKNKVAEIEALGEVDSDGCKSCTNKIHIIRELTWHEVLNLVNSGKNCTGKCNSGDSNSGDWNSGDSNSGDWNSGDWNSGNSNSGDWNSGDWNSGKCNSGKCNSGNWNSGDWNSGKCNSGKCNSGNWNSGKCNSGNWNSGNWNSGNWNSGNSNSGNRNSGNSNSGDWNSGDWNSGNWNSGDWNSGDWNRTSFSNGCFNTKLPKIFLFDKPSEWTYQDWLNSDARLILNKIPSNGPIWIHSNKMTDKEKTEHPEHSVTGGFLKQTEEEAKKQMWWDELSDKEKNAILSIPNFDRAIFKEITGIDVL